MLVTIYSNNEELHKEAKTLAGIKGVSFSKLIWSLLSREVQENQVIIQAAKKLQEQEK